MKFKNITVCGITMIVIDRKAVWTQTKDGWERQNALLGIAAVKTHDEMMEVVNHLKADRRYRMWVHGYSLNIVRA